ncbi:hypothetical protein B0F90DRAFT_1376696 [Multifurca ochricompacta]|uniref:Uncharacterized protein n=1 Tax=Multifurca ochricompacta TaxID=376703 RepID=A0AAD4M5X0_9AGAM|nr:hypothetical protein B0F90DRAFT_1376696 [Multifurca ochricompacta]
MPKQAGAHPIQTPPTVTAPEDDDSIQSFSSSSCEPLPAVDTVKRALDVSTPRDSAVPDTLPGAGSSSKSRDTTPITLAQAFSTQRVAQKETPNVATTWKTDELSCDVMARHSAPLIEDVSAGDDISVVTTSDQVQESSQAPTGLDSFDGPIVMAETKDTGTTPRVSDCLLLSKRILVTVCSPHYRL